MSALDELKNRLNTERSSTGNGSPLDELKKRLEQDRTEEEVEKVDSTYINTFAGNVNRYFSTAETDFNNVGWGNAASSYQSRYNDWNSLNNEANAIKSWMSKNQGQIDKETYDYLTGLLNNFDTNSSSILDAFSGQRDYFAQWETQKDYDDYVASQKAYDDMVNLDLEASQKEIDDLTAKRDAFSQNNDFDWTDAGQRQAHQQQMDAYEAEIAQMTQRLNQAKHIQEGIKLSSASGNADFNRYNGYVSTESDNWWKKMVSQYSMGYDDLTYEYINGKENGMRSEILKNAIAYNADNSLDETDKWKIYDHMTADEVSVYNYYYAKEGKEKAEEYLDSIQETLNHREATSMYEKMEDKTALELTFGVAAGLDQFESGVKNLFNTEDDYIAQTAYQIASGMVREDLADKGPNLPDWMGGASLGQVGYDAITTTANMAPSVLTSMAVSMVNPVAGEIVGTSLMGASAAGNAYQEALNLGYSKGQARAYSALVGGSEAGLQYLLGGIGKLGGKLTGNAVTKLVSGIDNAFARAAIKLGGSMLSEGMEEGLQEVLTPWFKNLVFRTDESVNWSEVAYSTLLGALTAGFMEGGGVVSGEVNTYKTGRKLQAADVSAQRLAEIGKTMSADTVAYQLAGRVNENTGAYTMGRLFNEIGAEITEMNKADIQRSLEQSGFPKDVAAKNAEAFARVVAGEKLTDGQISVIEANAELAKTVREVIIDPNSTVNQRTQGYKEVLKALAQEKTAPKASRMNPAEAGKENVPDADKVDAETEVGSEADASPVKVSKITSIQDGNVTIKLEDGSEVNAVDADLDPEEGVILKTIGEIGGISQGDANYIFNALKAAPGENIQISALGAGEAYRYGFYGMPEEHMTKHGAFVNSLTETQRRAIYETGRNARQTQVEAKQEAVSKKESVGDKNTPTGKVHFDGDRNALTERKRTSLTAMEKIADALGVQIYVFESKVNERGKRVGANGWYDPKDSSIHIDLHAGSSGEGTMLFTLAHELTHHIRKWSPAKFKILADFLMEEYGKKGVNVDALVREQINKAKRNRPDYNMTYDEAYEEVVADSMETMLADGNVMEKLTKLKQKDASLWQKIKDFISELAAKIRSVYEGLAPDSVEGRYVAEMKDSIEKLQELFAEALVDASENFQSAEKNTTQEGGVKYHARENGSLDDSEIQAIQGIGRKSINSFTAKDIQKTEGLARRYWAEMKEKSPFFRAWFGDWRVNDQTPVQVANQQGDTRGVQHNDDTGWDIQVSGKVFAESRHFASRNTSAIPYLSFVNDIVRKAVLLDSFGVGAGKAKSPNSILMHSLYAVADMGSGPELLKLYIEEINDPNRMDTTKRAYQLQNIEKAFVTTGGVQGQAPSSLAIATNAIHTVADLFAAVKQHDSQFSPNPPSKIVNSDGTPKVMYHGSPAQFTIFDRKKAKSSGLYGKGFYFTDSASHAGMYGNQYAVYLNIRSPLKHGRSSVSKAQVRKFLEAVSGNEDYSIENYGTYDVDDILRTIMGSRKKIDAFQVLQDINATAVGDLVEATELFNSVNGTDFDGIVVATETVAFYPTQIKSATDNIGTFDGSNPDIRYSIREAFYKEYDAWNKKDTHVSFVTGTTSDALKSIGMKDQNIVLRSGTVLQKLKDHPEMTFDIFKGIPELLEHPVIVQFSDAIDPKTKRPKYDSSITVLGELYADVKEGTNTVQKPVLVSLELLPTKKKGTTVLDFAIIKSAYSKNALQQYLNENSILYIDPDKKRTDSWLSRTRLQLPFGENRYGPIRKIAYVDGKVKVQSPKNMSEMQKKLFEAGVIDEFGNKIFSDRDIESVSNRSLLANALEGAAQNEIEQKKLQEYKSKIERINAEEQKLRELNRQIKDLSFAKGPRDTKKINALRIEAQQTANRIDICDTQLLRLEASKPLQNVLEREKKKAYQRAEQKGKKALDDYRLKAEAKQSEILRDYREARAALRQAESETAVMEKEFIRIVKAYDKLKERSAAKSGKDSGTIAELRTALKEEAKSHRQDQKMWESEFNRLLREYEAADRNIGKLEEKIERQKKAAAEKVEMRKRSVMREKIKAFKARLERSLLNPTDRQYVPMGLINAMVEVCDLIDTGTDLYKSDGSINKAQEQRNLTKEKLQNLKDEYEKLRNHADPIYKGEFDEMVYAYLTELRDSFAGKNLKEMNLDELREMYEILRSIEETLQDARKLIGWGEAETVYEAGDAIVVEQNRITKSRKGGKRNAVQIARDNSLNLSLSPVRNVERMSGYNQESSLLKLFKKFEQGIRKKNRFVMEAYKSFESLTSGKEYEDAIYREVGGRKYVDVNGRKFGVSKMQMMQAILSHEREAANGMHHIEGSGFSFADLSMLRKGKLRDAISEEYSHRVPAAVELAAEFAEVLKNDRWCQDYMSAARKFFNGTAKDAINETGIALKHRIIAKDKSYIPFEVDKNFVVREISAENDIQQTINSYGMLKDVQKGASQPLIITGLNNILDRHIDQVGNVYGLAIEVRNFNKVWNAKSLGTVGNDPTVKAAIQRNWGIEGVKHIEQAVQDIQGKRIRERSTLYDKVKSGYIGATFLLNLSVVTKQIGSLFSATSMLKWRGPVRQIGNLLYTMANHKKISAEVDRYTATAWMRRQGLSDAELHTFMTEGKKTLVGRAVDKLPAVFNPGKWITAMDHAVALSLWKYAKADTAKRTGLNGDELLKATAEFYDEVIENTQSMTDVLHRPEIQKRGDIISESLAMFKTDLYQMAGQLQVTAGRFEANKTKENGKALGRTVYAIAMSAVWAQLMTTVFALLRYKVNHYRDDEDKDLTYESWLKKQSFALAGDLMGYLFPIFGSEAVGVFENIMYGESEDIVDSIALTVINDLLDTMVTAASAMKDGDMPKPDQMKKLTIKALQVFGVPANNIIRTYEAIHLHAKDIANGEFLSFEAGVDRSPKQHMHRIVEAMEEGRTDVAKGLFEEAIEETAIDKTGGSPYSEDDLKSARDSLRTALGNKFKEGDVSEHQAVEILVSLFDYKRDDAKSLVGEWAFKVEYGVAWSDRSDAYLDGTISARELKTALMNVGGKTAEEADEYIVELNFEKKFGFPYKDLKEQFMNGSISASEAKTNIIVVEGKSGEDAGERIAKWQFEADYPELIDRVTYAQYKRWETDGQPYGVSIELFADVAEFRDDGTSSSSKSQEEVAAYINSLSISTSEKDALWCCFWKESTLHKAPWH